MVALLAVALAAVLVLLTPSGPSAQTRLSSATGSPVRQTTLACPPLLASPAGVQTSHGVGLVERDGLGSGGTLTTTPGPTMKLARGAATTVDSGSRQGLVVRGEGGPAQGLFAWRADTGSSTSVLSCPAPRASWWFTGAGASLDHESVLTLANLDTGPAVVDVRVLSPVGEADVTASGGLGITVPAGAYKTISLVELVPQSDEVSIHVHATRGRVVAAVGDRYAERPGGPAGFEWMPDQTEPTRVVRLTGTPPRAKTRTLLVANPSDSETLVSVEVAGKNGRFIPADVGDLSVAPATVTKVDLSKVLVGEPFAVRLRSERAVVAAMRSVTATGDIAYAGAADPVLEAAALPVVGRSTVQLTAGSEISRAVLTAYSSQGKAVGDTRLSLAAWATQTWDVPAGAAYVVVDPTQGNAFGSMVYSAADGDTAAVPFRELPISVRVPAVRPAS